jgi:hypothetical protein
MSKTIIACVVAVVAVAAAYSSEPDRTCNIPNWIGAVCEVSSMTEGRLRFDCRGRDGKIYTMIHSGGA